jgi:hypothetical protein
MVLALTAGLSAGCNQDDRQAARRDAAPVSRTGPLRSGEELWASPAPLRAPAEDSWSERGRLDDDVRRHLANLDRQISVLRAGLRNGAGPIPSEYLTDIRLARRGVEQSLARLAAPTPVDWDGIRMQVHQAFAGLDRAVVRARRAASPARRPIQL